MNAIGLVVAFLVLPFLVSGAFWLSPWLGWPAAMVCGVLWLGVILQMARTKVQP